MLFRTWLCITCLTYSVENTGNVSWFVRFQIRYIFCVIWMEVIEIHIQINKIIYVIRNFTTNDPKNRNYFFQLCSKVRIFQNAAFFPLTTSKNLKFQNRQKWFFSIQISCKNLLSWSNLERSCVRKSEFFKI